MRMSCPRSPASAKRHTRSAPPSAVWQLEGDGLKLHQSAPAGLYGLRCPSITVCERWLKLPDGILNFIADMGPRPGPEYSVERVDVNGNYEPGNCRWATPKKQAANMRPRARRAEIEVLQAENQ
jgi:hypothetical protein